MMRQNRAGNFIGHYIQGTLFIYFQAMRQPIRPHIPIPTIMRIRQFIPRFTTTIEKERA